MYQTLLLKPREFFRNFALNKNERHILVLLFLAGLTRAFDRAMAHNQGDDWTLGSIIGFALVFGALFGWLSLYIYAALVSWTSNWSGKEISTKSAIQVLAYASVPMILSLLFLAIQIALFGNSVFQSNSSFTESTDYYAFNFLLLLQILLSFYSLWLFIVGLAEVQKISLGKAALQAFLPFLFFITLAAVIFGIVFLTGFSKIA